MKLYRPTLITIALGVVEMGLMKHILADTVTPIMTTTGLEKPARSLLRGDDPHEYQCQHRAEGDYIRADAPPHQQSCSNYQDN